VSDLLGTISPSAPVLTPTVAYTGNVDLNGSESDVDVYRLNVDAGKSYYIYTERAGGLRVLNEDGSVSDKTLLSSFQEISQLTYAAGTNLIVENTDPLFLETTVSIPSFSPFQHTDYVIRFYELATNDFTNGDDWIRWQSDAQQFVGGGGIDTLSFYERTTPITLSLHDGQLNPEHHVGSPTSLNLVGIEKFKGTTGDDVMMGSNYESSVYVPQGYVPSLEAEVTWIAKEGDDIMGTTQGATTFYGGAGNDTASYAGASDAVNVSLLRGVGWLNDSAGDKLYGVENLTGSYFDDTLTGDHADNIINASHGEDILIGLGGDDTLTGGETSTGDIKGNINRRDFDTAFYFGNFEDYTITVQNPQPTNNVFENRPIPTLTTIEHNNNGWEGTDTLINVVYAQFADRTVDLRQVVPGLDDHGDLADATATELTIDQKQDVFIGLENDIDVFRVTLQAGETYDVIGEAWNNIALDIIDSTGATVFESGAIDVGRYSRFEQAFVPDQTGEYFFQLSAPEATGGEHRGVETLLVKGSENQIGTSGDDVITFDSSFSFYDGGAGNDTFIFGQPGFGFRQTGPSTAEFGSAILQNFETFVGFGGDKFYLTAGAINIIGADTGFDEINFQNAATDALSLTDKSVGLNLSTGLGVAGLAIGHTYSNIEDVVATNENDTIIGSGADNEIQTLDGDDVIEGKGGDDELYGGEGQDTYVYNGSVDDYEIHTFGRSVYVTQTTSNVAFDDGADRIIDSSPSTDVLQFADETISLSHLELSGQTFVGSFGRDIIIGWEGDDIITGGHSDDILYGGIGEDTAVFRYIQSQYDLSLGFDSNDELGIIVDYVGPWSGDGRDFLHSGFVTGFETLQFRDMSIEIEQTNSGHQFSNGSATFIGDSSDEIFFSDRLNQTVEGGAGDDLLYDTTSSDNDIALFRYVRSQYEITRLEEDRDLIKVEYVGPWFGDGTDYVLGYETLQFRDVTISAEDVPFA
jgi:Ca2+-binding RTX toxin-like protein